MHLQIRKLQKALNPAYRKQTVKREDMEAFKRHLRALLGHLNPEESEENAKGHLNSFLKSAFYGGEYLIATKERADLVIHSGPKADSPAAVLIETKRPHPNYPLIRNRSFGLCAVWIVGRRNCAGRRGGVALN